MSSLPSLSSLTPAQLAASALLALPAFYLLQRTFFGSRKFKPAMASETKDREPQSIMQPPKDDLAPPKDDPFTLAQLQEFDGSQPGKPIYVAIKGTVFDVTRKADTYGPGKSYNLFAGKDGSRALGMSSLKPEDAVPDYSALEPKERKVLDDWHGFFSKRYNIVGKVVDLPDAVKNEGNANL